MNNTEIQRHEPCRICGGISGVRMAELDYWDLRRSALVRCPGCGHMQLDPMLTAGDVETGCLAYYLEEALRVSPEEQVRNCVKNFRRGVLFGWILKRSRIAPREVLELGPGTGYFTAGLQFVFPDAQVTVMDVNREVLRFNSEHHGHKTLQGIPDGFVPACKGKFDLVIARDILEHVTDISATISNVNLYLAPGGLFHFITPNGIEDAWKHILAGRRGNQLSELLINHVNYFEGNCLKNLLTCKGFSPVSYYNYTFKYALLGNGWKNSPKLMSPLSTLKSAVEFIRNHSESKPAAETSKEEILKKWYIRPGAKWITCLYSLYQHFPLLRLSPRLNVGHEIYGLFRKD